MSSGYAKWSDVKARGHAADPQTSEEQSAARPQPASAGKPMRAGTS